MRSSVLQSLVCLLSIFRLPSVGGFAFRATAERLSDSDTLHRLVLDLKSRTARCEHSSKSLYWSWLVHDVAVTERSIAQIFLTCTQPLADHRGLVTGTCFTVNSSCIGQAGVENAALVILRSARQQRHIRMKALKVELWNMQDPRTRHLWDFPPIKPWATAVPVSHRRTAVQAALLFPFKSRYL